MANTVTTPWWMTTVVIPVANIVLAFAVCSLLFLYIEVNPIDAIVAMVDGSFGNTEGLGYTLFYATGYIFTGLAVAVAFHCGLFNIGGEGQATFAGLGVTAVALALGPIMPMILVIPLAIIMAGVFGAAWAYIPAYLQAKRGSHIVITTIMFNFIAASLMVYLLVDWLRPPGSMSSESAVFPTNSWMPRVWEWFGWRRSPLNLTFIVALLAAYGTWLFLWRTRWGYEVRALGFNHNAARFAGISDSKVVILAMLVSGMLAGLFAVNALLGDLHQLKLGYVAGFGFTGIAVALMGRNHPVGIVLAAVFFGFLYQGGAELKFAYEVDRNIVVVLQGLVVLFSGALEHMLKQPLTKLYIRFQVKKKEEPAHV
ncbi:ABC transporter permease [Salinispirillum marinum]|uniref:ABC transporter permease n=2 Tax=Saccharospirillaceae TaxID=255527 RepID=A0ABV8BBV7_9GAMM